MIGPILVPYATEWTIYFPLYEPDGVDLCTTFSFEAGDATIDKDGGGEGSCTNTPVDTGSGAKLTLTSTETTCAQAMVYLIDQTGTKVFLDEAILIQTYGHASACFAFDFDSATVEVGTKTGFALSSTGIDAILDEVVESVGTLTLRQAVRVLIAVAAGLSSKGSSQATFRDTQDQRDVVVATVDANGQRTAVTLNLT